MSSRRRVPVRNVAASALVLLTLLGSGCSDDSGDAPAEAQTEEDAWCVAVRRDRSAVTSQRLETTTEAAELAPEELAEDYELVIDLLQYTRDQPADAVGIAERTEAAGPSIVRILAEAQARCGIESGLLGG